MSALKLTLVLKQILQEFNGMCCVFIGVLNSMLYYTAIISFQLCNKYGMVYNILIICYEIILLHFNYIFSFFKKEAKNLNWSIMYRK